MKCEVYEEYADFAVDILQSKIFRGSGDFLLRTDEDGKVFSFSGGRMWEDPYDPTGMECLERYWGEMTWEGQSEVLAELYISGEEPDKGWMELWRKEWNVWKKLRNPARKNLPTRRRKPLKARTKLHLQPTDVHL